MSTEVLTSVPGNIWKVLVEVGDEVSEGDLSVSYTHLRAHETH